MVHRVQRNIDGLEEKKAVIDMVDMKNDVFRCLWRTQVQPHTYFMHLWSKKSKSGIENFTFPKAMQDESEYKP